MWNVWHENFLEFCKHSIDNPHWLLLSSSSCHIQSKNAFYTLQNASLIFAMRIFAWFDRISMLIPNTIIVFFPSFSFYKRYACWFCTAWTVNVAWTSAKRATLPWSCFDTHITKNEIIHSQLPNKYSNSFNW